MTGRVVFLDHSAALSGAELFLAGMLEHARHIRPAVVLFQDGPLRERFETAGVSVQVVPLPEAVGDVAAQRAGGHAVQLGSLAGLSGFLRDLRRTVRHLGAQVVYTNSAKAHIVGVPLGRSLRLPTVMHVHNGIVSTAYGRANRLLLHGASGLATHTIVNSENTRASLRPRVADRSTLVYCPTVVHDDVETRRPGPRPLELALVGRLAPWKGQDLAVRALAELLDRRGSGAARLHVYGDALFPRDVTYRTQVQQLAQRLRVDHAVTWHGHVNDVPAAMSRHDVVVHASTTPEPMGQVVLEAMASGTPVVAAASGGPLELVDDGLTGLLYPMGDAGALAMAVLRLADEPELRYRLATRAALAVRRYSYDEVVPSWELLLEGLASSGGSRSRE